MKFESVLFDLDGTLTDPVIGITNSVAHALRRMGMPVPPREELYPYIGPPLKYGFETFSDVPADRSDEAVEFYREHFADKGLFENEIYGGVPEMLRDLCESGTGVYLATSKPTVFALRILEHFGIAEYFSGVVGSELDGRRTDKSEVIACVLDRYAVDPTASAMVGDRSYDMAGALKHGLYPIGVLYGYGSEEELRCAGAKTLFSDVQSLAGFLSEK